MNFKDRRVKILVGLCVLLALVVGYRIFDNIQKNRPLYYYVFSLSNSRPKVNTTIENIFKKIEVTDRTQAAVFAIRNNLITI